MTVGVFVSRDFSPVYRPCIEWHLCHSEWNAVKWRILPQVVVTGDSSRALGMTRLSFWTERKRSEESQPKRTVILTTVERKNLSLVVMALCCIMSFWGAEPEESPINNSRGFPHIRSEWHLLVILRCGVPKNLAPNVTALAVWCHSERSVSEVKNLKQIAGDSSYVLGMTNGLLSSPLMAGNVVGDNSICVGEIFPKA